MADKQAMDALVRVLQTLHREAVLMDAQGNTIPEGERRALPLRLETGEALPYQGFTWVRVNAPQVYCVGVQGEDAAAQDCAHLAATLAESMLAEAPANDREDVMRAALRDELSAPELDALATEHGIPMTMERCVLLFHGTSRTMRELINAGENDLLVEMDRHVMVLVKAMDDIEGYDELAQLAEATEQTIMSETGERPIVSVGEIKSTLIEMGASYRTAWRALEIGRMFHADKNIYAYNRLVLERFLSEINRELGLRYHHTLFNRKTQRLFNEEMLHTIEMFFEKDLNLSDTARQLYIHRNTLVYRLDKIQRQTGLDLRRFEDAIAFRMLLLLGKCGGDKQGAGR
ncbi:MAG: helix-turn-helix domain-containing protein [Oscillospiraceae bacterium]|jgi:carbohydrate diacid regulator|nr:helix-turn-helix domain-containing protein [Oscillospiraceae bacterium]